MVGVVFGWLGAMGLVLRLWVVEFFVFKFIVKWLLFVIIVIGGASLVDSFFVVCESECVSFDIVNKLIVYFD